MPARIPPGALELARRIGQRRSDGLARHVAAGRREPARHRAAAPGRIDEKCGGQRPRLRNGLEADAGERAAFDHWPGHAGLFEDGHVRQIAETSQHMRFDQRACRGDQDDVGVVSGAPAVVEPCNVPPAVDATRPVFHEGVGQSGKQALQDAQAGREKDMNVASLRHALARLRSPRQQVPLDYCHAVEMVR